MSVENIEDHQAFCCECGSVHFNLLKSALIECAKCQKRFGDWKEEPFHTPNADLPPIGEGPRKAILVEVEVPENWEQRLDMQWVLEREIHSDRWGWKWKEDC